MLQLRKWWLRKNGIGNIPVDKSGKDIRKEILNRLYLEMR